MKNRTKFNDDDFSQFCSVAAIVMGVATVAGAAMSADAAGNAADQQAGAARNAAEAQLKATTDTNAMQMAMFRQNLANQQPTMQSGQVAQAAILQGLGLGQLRATPGATGGTGAGISPGQLGPITNYGATQEELNAGAGAMTPGQLNKPFAPSDLTTDPSYKWRLEQGLKSLQSSAAARGGLLTGQGGVDINNYAQGAASQEYGAAFDRNRSTQNDLYNRLANLAGMGQVATGAIGTAGTAAANQMSTNTLYGTNLANQSMLAGSAAQAAGTMGAANAWNGAVNSGFNNWGTIQGMKRTQDQRSWGGDNYMPAGNYVQQDIGPYTGPS